MGRTRSVQSIFIVVVCLFLMLFSFSLAWAQKKPAIKLGVNLDITGYAAWLGNRNCAPFSFLRNR